jgi:hypothetical protein
MRNPFSDRPPARLEPSGELLFSFRDGKRPQIDCELRDHGAYGWEARSFSLTANFDSRGASTLGSWRFSGLG